MTDEAVLGVLREAAEAVRRALGGLDDWGPAGTTPGQYRSDLVADEAAIAVLEDAGMAVLSEETGLHHPDRPMLAVLDPVDGSTNAARALPWFATSVCVLDEAGPRVALVVNQATGERFEAVRGGGASLGGRAIAPSGCASISEAVVALGGWPSRHLGWRQMRALGAAVLDLCAVADGRLDAYIDCGGAHCPWDYLGGLLICQEAGACVADAEGRELVSRDPSARRSPVAAATPELLAQALSARSQVS